MFLSLAVSSLPLISFSTLHSKSIDLSFACTTKKGFKPLPFNILMKKHTFVVLKVLWLLSLAVWTGLVLAKLLQTLLAE